MADISIIIPVYNKGPALCGCLDSVLGQSFRDFECILIDDGSTDDSPGICDRYAAADRRVRVLHKPNGGVSSARNAGIGLAEGRFLFFCDADDTLPADALQKLLPSADDFDSQLIVGDIDHILIDTAKNTLQSTKGYNRSYCQISTDDAEALYSFWLRNNMLSACGKLFVRQIVTENGLRFDPGLVVMEDYAFVIDYLSHCRRLYMIPDVVYRYISWTSESIAAKRSRRDFFFDILLVSDKLTRYLSAIPLDDPEKFHKKSIYPTLRLAYDVLWTIETPNFSARRRKYKRIKQAVSDKTFQKMLIHFKKDFKRADHICLRAKSVWALVCLNGLRKLFKH